MSKNGRYEFEKLRLHCPEMASELEAILDVDAYRLTEVCHTEDLPDDIFRWVIQNLDCSTNPKKALAAVLRAIRIQQLPVAKLSRDDVQRLIDKDPVLKGSFKMNQHGGEPYRALVGLMDKDLQYLKIVLPHRGKMPGLVAISQLPMLNALPPLSYDQIHCAFKSVGCDSSDFLRRDTFLSIKEADRNAFFISHLSSWVCNTSTQVATSQGCKVQGTSIQGTITQENKNTITQGQEPNNPRQNSATGSCIMPRRSSFRKVRPILEEPKDEKGEG